MKMKLKGIFTITAMLLSALQAKYFEYHQMEITPQLKTREDGAEIALRIYLEKERRDSKYREVKDVYAKKNEPSFHDGRNAHGIKISQTGLSPHQIKFAKEMLKSRPAALDCFVYTTEYSGDDGKQPGNQSPTYRVMNIETHENLHLLFFEKNGDSYEVYPFDFNPQTQKFMLFSKTVTENLFKDESKKISYLKEEVLDKLLLLPDSRSDKESPLFESSVKELGLFEFEFRVLDEHCPKFNAAQFFFEHRTLMEYQYRAKNELEILQDLVKPDGSGGLVSYKESMGKKLEHKFHTLNTKAKRKAGKMQQTLVTMSRFAFGSKKRVKEAKKMAEKLKIARGDMDKVTESLNDVIYQESVNEKLSSYQYIEDVQNKIHEKEEILALMEKFGFDVDYIKNERIDGRQSVGVNFWRLENNHKQCYQMKQILTSLPRYKKPHWKVDLGCYNARVRSGWR